MQSTMLDKEHDEKFDHRPIQVSATDVDAAADLVAGVSVEVDADEAERVRRKIDVHILPMMCLVYMVQFMDKGTLASSAILGLREATHLTANQYNWLGTIFQLSYLVFEFPQNVCLQRFPVAKWMSITTIIWSIALGCHAACKNFTGLFLLRLVLGMCEGSITPGFMIVTAMFYTRKEQTMRVGFLWMMNGISQILLGFLSFGMLHIKTRFFEPWQWLMVVTGVLTFLTAIAFWFLFPDTPANAWFLNHREREIAVARIKVNQTGTENKHFKKHQMIEALLDRKTWIFALYGAVSNIPSSLANQRTIIVTSFNFTNLQTTLLGCVDGVISIAAILSGTYIATRMPNSRAYVAVLYLTPGILGSLLISLLPWSDKFGLLCSMWIIDFVLVAYVISLSWISCVTAGHTKRITVNAVMLSSSGIGSSVAPFMWQAKYLPRYHIPWIILGTCYLCCMILLLALRWVLNEDNKRRDSEPIDDTYDNVYIEKVSDDGATETVKLDKEFLDLTDCENRDYRYVL